MVVSFACADSAGLAPSGVDTNDVAGATVSTEGENQSVTNTGSCVDEAGNAADAVTVSGINIDKTAPSSPTAIRTPAANGNGWNSVSPVQVSFNDNGDPGAEPSGIDTCTATSNVAGETSGTDVAGTCTDKAGNISAATTVTVRIDLTKPVITGTRTPAPNAFGWNNTDVVVSFACADGGAAPSGIDTSDVAGATLTAEGENQSVTNTGSCADKAGNVADAATVSGISIDKTAPNAPTGGQSPAANANGWNNTSPVQVTFTDNGDVGAVQSGIDGCTAASSVTGETSGTAVPGTCTDKAGNTSLATTVTARIDLTKPTITGTRTPANAFGWNNTDVVVSFTCADGGAVPSGLDVNTVAGSTVTGEGANQSVTNTGSCVDKAGNTADAVTVSGINIDKTAPTITVALDRAPAASGWFNLATGSPTASFTCSDGLSGLAGPCPSSIGPFAEGADQSASGSVTDKAGNSASASLNNIDVDLTVPGVSITTPVNGALYVLNQAVASDYACTDALSGINTCAGPVADGANFNTSTVGPHSFAVNATDVAGNPASLTHTYAVQYSFLGFFSPVDNLPVLNGVNAGRAIPLKWELRDALGNPVLNLANVAGITYVQIACGSESVDPMEYVADDSGTSELRLTATGYHFNWKTEKGFANRCYTLRVALNDSTVHEAKFKFKK